jgi:hypothetical protein
MSHVSTDLPILSRQILGSQQATTTRVNPAAMERVNWAGIFLLSRESLIHSPAKQRVFSPLQKGFFPFCDF